MSLHVLCMKQCSVVVVLGQNTYRKRLQQKEKERKKSPAVHHVGDF